LCRGVAQPGSALAWGASGRPFKSARPDQNLIGFPIHIFHLNKLNIVSFIMAICREMITD
jgi:hypothetical protein